MQRSQTELDALDALFSEYGRSKPSPPSSAQRDLPSVSDDQSAVAPAANSAPSLKERPRPNRPPSFEYRTAEVGLSFLERENRRWGTLSDWLPVLFAILAVVCFWWALSQQVEVTAPRPVTAAADSVQLPQFRRIRDIRVGFKVLSQQLSAYPTTLGALQSAAKHSAELHPEQHRLIRLQLFLDDGTVIDSELLRHVDFITSQGIAVGRRIPLELSEQETNGEALILAIEPCPAIEPGVGEVVTGTFSHITDEILELRVTGQAEPIGVTPEHPFWSIDRQEFVPVGELRIGETLRTVQGEQVAVESITPRGPPARVYNLEIDGAHQYHVSSLGLLVHNACAKPIDATRPRHGSLEHDATAFNQAKKWRDADDTIEVRFNQQLVDADGNPIPGFRPDAQRIRKVGDRKVVDVLEVRSDGQSDDFMNAKKHKMRELLGKQAGIIKWIEPEDVSR